MGLFNGIEKLINEHGSATILKERLELVKEQHDAEVGRLTEERDTLSSKVHALETQLATAEARMRTLENQLSSLTPTGELRLEEVNILQFLAVQEHPIEARPIENFLRMSPLKVEYFLTRLVREHYVLSSTYIPSVYEIGHAGREYLITRNLVD